MLCKRKALRPQKEGLTHMKYRRFGRTNLNIPVISCGGMRFQQSWKSDDPVSEASQKNLEACVRRAYELGINHFETARGYGTSEQQLGKILPTLPRDKIIVQTKIGGMEDINRFRETFELSMRLLKVEYLDLFAFHGINNDECLEHALHCLDQVRTYQKEGRIRFVGFSTHGHCSTILKAIKTGEFDYVNLHYYYIFQDNWPAIEEAHRRDMGVFIISPNDKGGLLFQPSPKFTKLTAPLHPLVFNGLFCLTHPEVHTLSCGVAKPEDFDIHIETAEKSDQAAEIIKPILERLQAEMEKVLGREWVRTWHEGLPEWYETPGEVNIPWILRLRNFALAFDMLDFAKMRYNLLGNGGHWFPGNKADKLDELDLSTCLQNSPHKEIIPKLLREAHDLFHGEARKRLQQEEG